MGPVRPLYREFALLICLFADKFADKTSDLALPFHFSDFYFRQFPLNDESIERARAVRRCRFRRYHSG